MIWLTGYLQYVEAQTPRLDLHGGLPLQYDGFAKPLGKFRFDYDIHYDYKHLYTPGLLEAALMIPYPTPNGVACPVIMNAPSEGVQVFLDVQVI